jgi:2,4-dienoyl-CoA reductase-like NADH-dependent reductase (Old Yellow Enzyme family)
MTDLFSPLQAGELALRNRIVMAPLTRTRAPGRLPTPLMAEYYRQRASAGLIISEATVVSPRAVGYADTPGIWSPEQVEAWKPVTRAVHEAGGLVVMQLWHVGRISHPSLLDGQLPLAPSAITPKGHVSLIRPETAYVAPHAMTGDEIADVVAQFRRGAANAQAAGFDGVELHGANGYLLDQFLQDGSNHREDDYGGSIENRARLLLACTDAAIDVWGPGRVGVHLSPRCDAHDMGDSDPAATFGHVARELGRRHIAFICAREHSGAGRIGPQLRTAFGGTWIANEGFDAASGNAAIAAGEADAVAYGKLFIANPDLPQRFREQAPLNPPDFASFYGQGPQGYTDYPAL